MSDATHDGREEHAPFLCPWCSEPADIIRHVLNQRNGVVVFWHDGCRKILGLAVVPLAQHAQHVIPVGNLVRPS